MDDSQHQQELLDQVEQGRKSKIAGEVVGDFIKNSREITIQRLEDGIFDQDEVLRTVMYLRVLKRFERSIDTNIEIGELAEKELNENAD